MNDIEQTGGLDEARWVFKAQAGDRSALDQLLRQHEIPLLRHVYRVIGDEPAAYDALQETFIVVAKNIQRLRVREKFKAWLFGVATRVALSRRSRSWYARVSLGSDAECPDERNSGYELFARKEEVAQMLREVDALSAPLRAVILLHYIEELTLDETASALELPLGTVKSRLAAGLAQLRRSFMSNLP